MKEKKDIRSQLRDWLAEICPKGKPEDYCQIMANSAAPELMKVRVFTHDYRYSIFATGQPDGSASLACTATRRKSLAGLTEHPYADLVNGRFTRVTWELIKASILRFELVKIAVKAREDQWQKETSHYEHDGRKFYCEWLQKGDLVKDVRTYELRSEVLAPHEKKKK